MKSIILNRSLPDKIELADIDLPELGANEVKVKIKAAALNHRDEWSRQGLYPNLLDGVVLGSDGAGWVAEVGRDVPPAWLGREVIINPAFHWGDDQKAQSKTFKILGMPDHGTLASYVQVPADRLWPKPLHLTWEQAAALPLAGLTAYRALFVQGGLQAGEKVLVTGIGGGVAQFAAQFAIAAGGKVYVSSGNVDKIKVASSLGALAGFNYQDPNWMEMAREVSGGFDIVLDSAMGDTLPSLIDVVKPGGRIVLYGATRGNPGGFNARKVFWSQISIKGSTMGSDRDFGQMLDFVNSHKILPLVDRVFAMEQAVEAFDRMKTGQQMGKIVFTVS